MNLHTRQLVEFLLNNIRDSIKNPAAKLAIKKDPNLQDDIKRQDEYQIKYLLKLLKDRKKELIPFVRSLREKIPDITDLTLLNAEYLLLNYAFHIWESIFILAEKGQYSSTFTLIRMIKEISMLAQHFMLEAREGKDTDLKRWFAGEIITHGEGRESYSKFAEEDGMYPDFDLKTLQAHLYQAESLTPHSSYVSVLDTVSPFTEDVDFDGYKGYRRTVSALRYANGTMTDINLALKMFYNFVINDGEIYQKLDEILLRYDPDIERSEMDPDILTKFKKQPKS